MQGRRSRRNSHESWNSTGHRGNNFGSAFVRPAFGEDKTATPRRARSVENAIVAFPQSIQIPRLKRGSEVVLVQTDSHEEAVAPDDFDAAHFARLVDMHS